jgi:UrcA family protein
MLKTIAAMAALAIATALVVPTVSQAADRDSARVSFADLNLASDAGQKALQRRIAFAARSVCDQADPRDLDYMRAVSECRKEAITNAQPAYQAAVAAASNGTVDMLGAALTVTAH